ncbi:hypothetical protein ACO0K9_12265 [Undibacterium sp. Ji50W]|uniref:phage adaptor protein n=1 Tax=Undibacterium sp. Ji50W TaxID=3413041 RepID=UPI003BF453C6
MNYLSIVNALREKCGASGAALTTVTGLSGESLKFCNWVNDAWMDIQGMNEHWEFMRASFSFNTVAQQQAYTPLQANAVNFGNWKTDSFRLYQTALGTTNETWLPCRDYGHFRNLYQFGAMRTAYQRPVEWAASPAKAILLGAAPNAAGYTVTGEYYLAPQELQAATDVPSLPTEYHRAIVYRAMMFYGGHEAASEVFQLGQSEFDKVLARLELNQLPPVRFAEPLL